MPHIVVEYSENLQSDVRKSELLKKLHKVVLDAGVFSPEAIKARGVSYSDYVMPEGYKSFIHVTTSILAGRDVAIRTKLSDEIFAAAKAAVPSADKVSSNIHEMSAETYRK
jgi:5-carboxymethyl-2-hydroxymuconate isomerase